MDSFGRGYSVFRSLYERELTGNFGFHIVIGDVAMLALVIVVGLEESLLAGAHVVKVEVAM